MNGLKLGELEFNLIKKNDQNWYYESTIEDMKLKIGISRLMLPEIYVHSRVLVKKNHQNIQGNIYFINGTNFTKGKLRFGNQDLNFDF